MGTNCTFFIDDLPMMLPTKFWFIWPSVFRGEDFLEITKTWWEATKEGSVLNFLKAEWKMNDTGSAHWASSSMIG
jgi:hypothetical protein